MKLFALLKGINCRVFGNTILDISGLYHRDIDVKEEGLFFCLRGTKVDGKDYVESAINNGAVAIVTEQEIAGLNNITQVVVKNARETMSLIACKFYCNPAEKLKIIGVTGTNGKTTVSTILMNMFSLMGKKSAVIGTNGICFGSKHFDTGMTTPDPIELQQYFSLMVKSRVEYVCIEVSAHAIDLNKIEGFKFEQVIFTNLTEDHLDYFKTMENYFLAKSKLFTSRHTKFAIINIDDNYGLKLSKSINLPFVTYAIDNSSNIKISNIKWNGIVQEFEFNGQKTNICLAGKFNLYNVMSCILSLENFGFSDKLIADTLPKITPVEGRFNIYCIAEKKVIIDYAHTPDGLLNLLETCKDLKTINSKIILLFGCGGNREQKKRKIMGEIASKYADFSIITSDNPRFEDKTNIANEIASGFINKNFKIIIDRSKAIKYAIENSSSDDIIVIAGKGAENYIEENGVKIPYSDKLEIEKYRR